MDEDEESGCEVRNDLLDRHDLRVSTGGDESLAEKATSPSSLHNSLSCGENLS